MSGRFVSYLGLRALRAAATIFGVVSLVFLLVRAVPGDPVQAILGDQAAPEDRIALRRALLLDRPFGAQYAGFLGTVADGTLGRSFRQQERTVSSLLAEVLPNTVELALLSILIAWSLAIPLGSAAAVHRGRTWDSIATGVGLAGVALPAIWLGPLLILLFCVELRWLPFPGEEGAGWASQVLPAVTLGAALAAILTRQTRSAMIEVLSEQYILAARARGVSAWTVLIKHALRNAVLPVLTVGAAQVGAVLSGTVVAEKIFERKGLGTLFLDAFFDRDIPVVQGCVLVIAAVYVLTNLFADLLYGLIDPRVRLT